MGVGTEILFMITLGLVVLGPKRLHSMMGHVARAKAELENATRSLKSQLGAELDGERAPPDELDVVEAGTDVDDVEMERLALASARVQEQLQGRQPAKVVTRPPKLVNLVVTS